MATGVSGLPCLSFHKQFGELLVPNGEGILVQVHLMFMNYTSVKLKLTLISAIPQYKKFSSSLALALLSESAAPWDEVRDNHKHSTHRAEMETTRQ